MSYLSLATLLYQETKEALYAKALAIADTLGLLTTSWHPGDPTRSLYHTQSEELSVVEAVVVKYIAAGFLDYATGDWLTLLAYQVFRVERIEATCATTTVTLSNNGGELFEDIEPGALTFKNNLTGATYRNTTGGTLDSGPGTTLDIDVEANDAGSDGSAAATEIDTLVTTLLEVTCSNATAAVGVDEESDKAVRARCRLKLGALSPNGPADAYDYVARTPALTGTTNVTRSRTVSDGDGEVTVYLAGPSGAVAAADVTLVEAAITEWALPLGITPTVVSASNVVVDVTYQLWIYEAVGETTTVIKAAVKAALTEMIRIHPIGGDVVVAFPGHLYKELIEATILKVYPAHAFRVSVSVPAAEVAIDEDGVATLGTVTPTITVVDDP